MKRSVILILSCVVQFGMCSRAQGQEAEFTVWKAVGGFHVRARFVRYEAGVVTLRREDGREVPVPLTRLIPSDRVRAQQLATRTRVPQGIQKPTGRRELVWDSVDEEMSWPAFMPEEERAALDELGDRWQRRQTKFFVVHFQKETYARKVGRQADFFYEFIGADLLGMKDLSEGKSHIIIIDDAKDWSLFLSVSGFPMQWASAYVRGNMMMVHDMGKSRGNANVLGHEMTHLVLNRFFRTPPPLWLNEGLAEWYGGIAWKAFKGQHYEGKNVFREELTDPIPVNTLIDMSRYPEGEIEVRRFYRTSQYLVGFLMLRQELSDFITCLKKITGEGLDAREAVQDVYALNSVEEWNDAFLKFLE